MLAFNARSKCPKVLFLSLIFHLLSKLLSTRICFSTYEEFHHLALNTESNVTPLIPVTAFPVDAVTRTDADG